MRRATTRWCLLSLVTGALLWPPAAFAAPPASTPAEASATPEDTPAAAPAETAERAWSLSASVGTYIVPDTPVYAQPTVALDQDWVHLEARYNYESLETGSLWLGFNVGVGETVTLAFTPMVGGVFGDVTGVAPGGKLTLGYWKLELYTEAEYLFDTDDHNGNFWYAWSELTLAPLEWMHFGLVSQRTRAYETDVDIQRGLLLGLAYRWFSFTTYVFNLDQSRQTVVLSVGAEF